MARLVCLTIPGFRTVRLGMVMPTVLAMSLKKIIAVCDPLDFGLIGPK